MHFELERFKPLREPDPLEKVGNILRMTMTVIAASAMLSFIGVFVWLNLCLAWIAYWPVPDVPRKSVEYEIQDTGPVGTMYEYQFGNIEWEAGCVLTEQGMVKRLSLEQVRERLDLEKRRKARWEAIHASAKTDQFTQVIALGPDETAFLKDLHGWYFWRNGWRTGPIRPEIAGYKWRTCVESLHGLNAFKVVIGSGRIATAYASSGGTSSPHGRDMALIWRPDWQEVEDLNSRIAAASGWYLTHALDINDRGQILCIGHRTDAKGAENKRSKDGSLLILTPLSAVDNRGAVQ
jgi:hypothetical protein